ncbi:MAG: DNA adenine methylase [Candidatus Gastranaerophilaceae bacterium]
MVRKKFGGYLVNWVGGKRLLREAISYLIPENINSYIEPFGGGGWVLFYYNRWADLEVYNDLDGRLVNLFRVVKYHPCELAREMCYLLASREQFAEAIKFEGYTDIQRACRFMFLLTRSFGGRGNHFGVSYESSIKSAGGIIERIDTICKRLDKTIIEHLSAFDLIPQYDTDKAFFYCDPPYSCGAGYEIISTKDFNHERLRDVLKNIKGRFLLSYDDAPIIRELYKKFNIIEIERMNGINRKNVKNNVFKELLICNYDVNKIDGRWQVDNHKFKQEGLFG